MTNQGSIASSADVGALFGGGGRLANTGTAASVSGANYGVLARYAAFTVTNSDRITGTAEAGVAFNDGGVVTDAAGAHITGGTVGVQGAGSTISVNNAGINTATSATSSGVDLQHGGTVVNSGSISGGQKGARAAAAATLTNTGSIAGGSGYGVYFVAGASSRTAARPRVSLAEPTACWSRSARPLSPTQGPSPRRVAPAC